MNINKKTLIVLGLKLGLIAGIAAMILTLVEKLTLPARQSAKEETFQATLKKTLPPFNRIGEKIAVLKIDEKWIVVSSNDQIDAKIKQKLTTTECCHYCPAYDQMGRLIGFAGEGSSPNGYGGKITVMCGLTPEGTVGIVNVIEHNETPGLGTKETDRKRTQNIFNIWKKQPDSLPENIYLDQFEGKKITKGTKPWTVKKEGGEIDYCTGATVSMKAISDASWKIVYTYFQNKEAILAIAEGLQKKISESEEIHQ